MPHHTCLQCGAPFDAGRQQQSYCTVSCRKAAQYRRLKGHGKGRLPQLCEWCGATFTPGKVGARCCSYPCAQYRRRYDGQATAIPWHPCTGCGRPFIRRTTATTCSPDCRRTILRMAYASHRLPCSDCGRERSFRKKLCDICRAERLAHAQAKLVAYRHANRKATKAADRARRRGARTTERFDPAEIFQRDGYRCQLCGERLLMGQAAPHPKSPSIDHIVPIACGGMHERSNSQAAHLLCNSLKGARGGPSQLRLMG